MATRGRARTRGRLWIWLFRFALFLAFLVLLTLALVPLTIGPRLWRQIPCRVTVNGRFAREAKVFRSADGSLLVDLRHAPMHVDIEGGGYLVQPFWNRLRSISHDYYKIYGPFVLLRDIWPPGAELRPDDPFVPVDPKITGTATHLSFDGLEGDHVEIFGRALLERLKL